MHDIESVYDCQAFDVGFAVVIPERKGYGCDVACLSGGGCVATINPEPNTNLLFTKTKIPMVFYQIHKGSNHLETVVSLAVAFHMNRRGKICRIGFVQQRKRSSEKCIWYGKDRKKNTIYLC